MTLAGVVNRPGIAPDVLAIAHPEMFYVPKLRRAMEAVAEAVQDGLDPEPITVATRMGDPDDFDVAGLLALTFDAPTSAGTLEAARIVARRATERRVLAEAKELERGVLTGHLDDVLPAVVERLGGVRLAAATPTWYQHARHGGEFVLDAPVDVEPIWGRGDDVLWASGEPFLMVGPTGVGKTTLALQVLAGQLGILDEVLGFPVRPATGPVLYLAMDRPNQIRRAMRRLFGEEHRQVLEERLIVWNGPLPTDLGKSPDTLVDICRHFGAVAVWLDSLKDAVCKLTDPEHGGTYNRSVQAAVASGVDVGVLHHQRKGQNGAKPSTLEDVYGSVWVTAGAGSVVLLWGAAGDPLVELKHLKQPAAEVGPLKIEHNHLTGRSTVYRGMADPFLILQRRPNGITATELAVIMFEAERPSESQRKKAERALDRLVRDNLAVPDPSDRRNEDGTLKGRRYHLAETRHLEAV